MSVSAAISAHPLPILELGSRAVFTENMLFMHALMVASEPLIEEAIRRPLDAALRSFYEEHLEEERDHASWLEDDLGSLGARPREVDWNAAQIAGTQYYLIRHVAPQALLGYMAALECRPMPLGVVEELEKVHGKNALRTLRYHATHDAEHAARLLGVIESAGRKDIIFGSAEVTARMLRIVFAKLAAW